LFQTQKSKRFNTNALTQLVKRLYERVGIVGATSHSMRRTFITKLATSGVSVRVIAEAVGHASISTTQRYIDVNDELISNAVELV
jgi:integrase/recombinase XerD